jgi:serine/threonine protein kinase
VLRCLTKSTPWENKDRAEYEYNEKADVWSVGVLAWECVIGRAPFKGKDRCVSPHSLPSRVPRLSIGCINPSAKLKC